jgi:hypothetical protein
VYLRSSLSYIEVADGLRGGAVRHMGGLAYRYLYFDDFQLGVRNGHRDTIIKAYPAIALCDVVALYVALTSCDNPLYALFH